MGDCRVRLLLHLTSTPIRRNIGIHNKAIVYHHTQRQRQHQHPIGPEARHMFRLLSFAEDIETHNLYWYTDREPKNTPPRSNLSWFHSTNSAAASTHSSIHLAQKTPLPNPPPCDRPSTLAAIRFARTAASASDSVLSKDGDVIDSCTRSSGGRQEIPWRPCPAARQTHH